MFAGIERLFVLYPELSVQEPPETAIEDVSVEKYDCTAAVNTDEIRQWARNNGLRVRARGRLNSNILDAYAAAHPAD
jgi:hypothetical protein